MLSVAVNAAGVGLGTDDGVGAGDGAGVAVGAGDCVGVGAGAGVGDCAGSDVGDGVGEMATAGDGVGPVAGLGDGSGTSSRMEDGSDGSGPVGEGVAMATRSATAVGSGVGLSGCAAVGDGIGAAVADGVGAAVGVARLSAHAARMKRIATVIMIAANVLDLTRVTSSANTLYLHLRYQTPTWFANQSSVNFSFAVLP